MKYGNINQVSEDAQGNVEVVEQSVRAYEKVKDVRRFEEMIKVADEKQVLNVFLQLLKDHKEGRALDIGIEARTDKKTGKITKIIKKYTDPSSKF